MNMHWEKSSCFQKDYCSEYMAVDESLKSKFSVCDGFNAICPKNICNPENKGMIQPEDRDSAKLDFICEKAANQNHEMSDQTIRDVCIQTQESLSSVTKDELNMVLQASSERESSGEHGNNNFKEFNFLQNVVTPPKLENVSWRTADAKQLVALVSHKAKEHLENCDLPPPQSPSICKRLLEQRNLSPATRELSDVSRSMDKDPLISIFHERQPACPENRKLPLPPVILGHSNPFIVPRKFSRSLHRPTVVSKDITPFKEQELQQSSSETRPSSWIGGEGFHNDCGYSSELLGQALCHSQTRAREAEEAEAQAFLEKEKLVQLLFREASLTFNYRQWIKLLQAENSCLRLHAGDQAAVRMRHNFAWLSNNRCKHKGLSYVGVQKSPTGNDNMNYLMHWWSTTRSDVMVGFTIGLAFTFGLTLAGAGLSCFFFAY